MNEYMEEVKRLAHAYADAKLVRYGMNSTDPLSADPEQAFSELIAHIQRGAVPDGWQVVPKEPTKDMVEAAYDNVTGGGGRAAIYAAMLAAAPAPDHFRDAVAAPAEVPMPQGYVERPSDYTGDIWIESQMRAYGDAREAAGYARGLAEAGRYRHLRALVASDSYAVTFQSLAQYRTALLKYLNETAPEIQQANMRGEVK